jgi:hypothetical protein
MVDNADAWQVVVAAGQLEDVLAEGDEAEARRVYADTVAQAADRGYQYVRLRHAGQDIDGWPPATGWTS